MQITASDYSEDRRENEKNGDSKPQFLKYTLMDEDTQIGIIG